MFSGNFRLEDQVVLITGGSQGLGKQFAHKYYHETERSKIIVVSRSEQKLKAAIEEITGSDEDVVEYNLSELDEQTPHKEINKRIFYLPCDLSDFPSVQAMFEMLLRNQLTPTVILSCVGGSIPKLFKDLTPQEIELGINQNYKSVVTLTHTLLQQFPSFKGHSAGDTVAKCHLVVFSSEVSFFPFIGYGQYAPLKVAMKSLISVIRQELMSPEYKGKLTLSCVYPGNFQSEGYELEETTKPAITKIIEGPSSAISCQECCNKIVYWLDQGYTDVTTDAIGWVLMALDMGLNKNNNNSFCYWLQLILGCIANLLIVPLYMVVCSWQIKHYFQSEQMTDQNNNKKKE